MSQVEQPDYQLIRTNRNIEIRDYPPMILAEVQVSGERKEAIRAGFKMLANYIFGNNTSHQKMEMTAPVTNTLSEKMAMTAPVIQQKDKNLWKIRFVMPKKYTLETLPIPNSEQVSIISVPARRFAVIRFSGLADDELIKKHREILEAYIASEKLRPLQDTTLAFYNPPWTLPCFRRNEVMIEIGKDQ